MNRKLLIALPWVLGAMGTPAFGAEGDGFSLSGSVRVRQEALDGQFRPGFDDRDAMLALRSAVLLQWQRDDWQVVGELSDSRAYGLNAGSVLSANEVNTFEPVQAYVRHTWRGVAGEGSSVALQAGRFTLNVGSRRLVASDDYRNTPQGHLGVRAELHTAGRLQWQAFYVLPQQRRPDDFASLRDNEWALDHEGRDLQLWGALASRAGLLPDGGSGELSYIGLAEDDRGSRLTRNRSLHSVSARAWRDPAPARFDYDLEAIGQWGHVRASTADAAPQLDVRAWFIHAEAGYGWQSAWKPHLALEYDHASGDGPGARFTRFDTLFGSRRSDLAPSGTFAAIGRTNVQALGLRAEITPHARLDAMLAWRLLRADAATDSFSTTGIRDATGAAGRDAGQLLDARLRYWMVPRRLRAELTGVWLQRGRLLREAPNASPWGDTHYGAAALTYTF